MSNKMIGYARVSTTQQSLTRQIEELTTSGVRKDDLYTDKISGGIASRQGLDEALGALQAGDTLVITTLDRLGRSTTQMLKLAEHLQDQGIALRVLNLGGGEVDTATPMGKLLFTVMSALAEMEREIRVERVKSSIASRKKNGGSLGGRPRVLSEDAFYGIQRDIEEGVSVVEACRKREVSRATYYRYLKEEESLVG